MKYNPEIHHRRSIRLKGYDYSRLGAYFLTFCLQNRECLFGEKVDGEMQLNDAGLMINKWYFEIENKFPGIRCGEHVVMPNHFHCIVVNVGADLCVCPSSEKHTQSANVGADLRVCPSSANLSSVVQWFKTMTTNQYLQGIKKLNWRPFSGKLWQRNYYEHIIRNEESYQQIVEYIINNPLEWEDGKIFLVSWNGAFIEFIELT